MMPCPVCGTNTNVIDSRLRETVSSIRRRRRCDECGHRFSTFEISVTEAALIHLTRGDQDRKILMASSDDQLLKELRRRMVALRKKIKPEDTEEKITDPFDTSGQGSSSETDESQTD